MDTDDPSFGDAPDRTAEPTAELVQRAVAGDDRAFGELYDAWFDRVHDRAYSVVRDRSLAAEVTQDTFLRAWQQLDRLRDPTVFGGWLLRIARNTALNRLRAERRTTAVDDAGMAMMERAGPSPANAPAGFRVEDRLLGAGDPAAAVEDDEIVALVTEAAAALEGRDAEVLDLGLRLGLSPAEIGEAVGLNRNAANQAVHRARRRLRTAVEARVLWRRGRPDCPDLAAALTAAGVERFGAAAVAVADAHAGACTRCSAQRRLRLDPAVLFGAVPLVGAPGLLKTRIAEALSGQGVPMGGSVHGAGATAGSAGDPATGATDSTDPTDRTDPTDPADQTDPAAAERATDGTEAPTTVEAVEPVTPGPTARRGHRRAALVGLAGVVVLLALVAGTVVLAREDGGVDPRQGAAPVTRPDDLTTPSTTLAPTPTAPPASESESEAEAEPVPRTDPPRVVPPPATVPPTEPPPPPPAATGSIVMSPVAKSGTWLMSAPDAPRLTWSSAGAASVTVEGPGFTSGAANGSAAVCPPSGTSGPACATPPVGTYRYRLTLRDASGTVVFTQDASLTIG